MNSLFGRRTLYTDEDYIDDSNVIGIVKTAFARHLINSAEIAYLDAYYRGDQPILSKTKEFRTEINNKVVENRAFEIVTFKVGYLVGKPIKYVSRKNDDKTSEQIQMLNEYMLSEDKHTMDTELVEWMTIGGTAYRLVLPNVNRADGESPFNVYVLDPRYTFVIYRSGFKNEPRLGVTYYAKQDGTIVFDVYSANRYWHFEDRSDAPITSTYHIYGDIPIVEYHANKSKLGAFEIVIPMLDAINNVSSDRLDSIKQFVEAILFIKGFQLDDEQQRQLKELGGLFGPNDGDAKYLTAELNQMQTQTLVDYMDQTVRIICAMPNRNGGSSTSDTGTAVIYRDGWSDAETFAENTESYFQASEKRFLKLALSMMNIVDRSNLEYTQVDTVFTRRNYANDQTKINNLVTMLNCDRIHPRIAWQLSGAVADPENAYKISQEYYESNQKQIMDTLMKQSEDGVDEDEEANEKDSV